MVMGLTLALAASAVAASARAADSGTPSLFFNASGGYSVYKSDLVASNDTSTTVGYGFGVWAGSDHELGMALEREQTTVAFKLNHASIAVGWQDAALRYRLGPFYAGLLFTSSSWLAKAPAAAGAAATDLVDVTTSGYGGEFGFAIPAGKKGAVHVATSYAQAVPARQNAADVSSPAHTTTVGPRTDFDLGGALNLVKSIDLTCGFKYRTYKVTVDSTAHPELLNTTYVGIEAGWQL
jgi:hypothetical protein